MQGGGAEAHLIGADESTEEGGAGGGAFTLEVAEVDRAAIVRDIGCGLLNAALAAQVETTPPSAGIDPPSMGSKGLAALARPDAMSKVLSEAGHFFKRNASDSNAAEGEGEPVADPPLESTPPSQDQLSADADSGLVDWLTSAYGPSMRMGGSLGEPSVGMPVQEMTPLDGDGATAPLATSAGSTSGMSWRTVAQQVAAAKALSPAQLASSPHVAPLWLAQLGGALSASPGARGHIADVATAVFCLEVTRVAHGMSGGGARLPAARERAALLAPLPAPLRGVVDWRVVHLHAKSVCASWLVSELGSGSDRGGEGGSEAQIGADTSNEGGGLRDRGGSLHHLRHLLPHQGMQRGDKEGDADAPEPLCAEPLSDDDEGGEGGLDDEHEVRSLIAAWRHLPVPPASVQRCPSAVALAPDLVRNLEGMLLLSAPSAWREWALRCCGEENAPPPLRAQAEACSLESYWGEGPSAPLAEPHANLTEMALQEKSLGLLRRGMQACV